MMWDYAGFVTDISYTRQLTVIAVQLSLWKASEHHTLQAKFVTQLCLQWDVIKKHLFNQSLYVWIYSYCGFRTQVSQSEVYMCVF